MSMLALILPSLFWMRVSIAAVWLYEGLWCKVLGMMPSQLAIVTELPGFSRERAVVVWKSAGAVEIFLGIWVLTGVHPGWCALGEVMLLVVMNSNSLLWARHLVIDPVGMVLKNLTFLMLVWVCGAMAVRR